jgi:hypothetical protein
MRRRHECIVGTWVGATVGRGGGAFAGLVEDARDRAHAAWHWQVRTVITCSPGPALDAMLERGWPVTPRPAAAAAAEAVAAGWQQRRPGLPLREMRDTPCGWEEWKELKAPPQI